MRARIDEKEMTIVRKEQLLSTLSTDKTKRYSEVSELREMVEIKDRKIIVLQRKVTANYVCGFLQSKCGCSFVVFI